MSYQLIIKQEAIADMQTGYEYYEQQQVGLGDRFLSVLEDCFTTLAEHPKYYSFIDNKQLLRDVVVGIFPYVIVYGIIDEVVKVYAIHSTHKSPKQSYPE